MKTKGIVNILFIALAIGCLSNVQTPSDKRELKNIIEEFHLAERIVPTKRIDFLEHNDIFFIKGWSHAQHHQRWAEGLESILLFYATGNSDITMSIRCWPFRCNEQSNQSITINVNTNFLTTLELTKGERTYQVKLPSRFLDKGKNYLTFKYKYAQKPSEFFDTTDARKLSVAFKDVTFQDTFSRNPVLYKKENKIFQQPETFLNYYAWLPADCYLEAEIESIHPNVTGNITITSRDGPSKHTKFAKIGSKAISLKQFSNQYVQFSFWSNTKKKDHFSDNPDNEILTWSQIKIYNFSNKEYTDINSKNLSDFRKEVKDCDIIYLLFDAFHAEHSSLYGYNRKTTPFIDKLGEDGIVFANFFANHPYTLASTGTLLTSKYSHHHGLIHKNNKLRPILPTFTEILADNSIPSYLITGHGHFSKEWGLVRGFLKVYFDRAYEDQSDKIIDALSEIYSSENAGKRKFIYLHILPPHEPYTPPEEYKIFMSPIPNPINTNAQFLTKIENRKIQISKQQLEYIQALYDAHILYADHIAQTIYDYLDRSGVLEKAIIIITSDHGEAFMQHSKFTHNTTIYDEMIHIPLIIKFPDHSVVDNRIIKNIASIIDMPATIVDICNIQAPKTFDGKSLLPLMLDNKKHTSHIYAETLLTGQRCVRDTHYKYITNVNKILFDIVNDPLEQNNIFTRESIIAGYYAQLL
ncbi:MAG: sulfatase, partial [bacterium]